MSYTWTSRVHHVQARLSVKGFVAHEAMESKQLQSMCYMLYTQEGCVCTPVPMGRQQKNCEDVAHVTHPILQDKYN